MAELKQYTSKIIFLNEIFLDQKNGLVYTDPGICDYFWTATNILILKIFAKYQELYIFEPFLGLRKTLFEKIIFDLYCYSQVSRNSVVFCLKTEKFVTELFSLKNN